MSLFDDDFYSTKMSPREAWRLPKRGPFGLGNLPRWSIPVVGGVLAVGLLIAVYSVSGGGPVPEQEAVAAMGRPSGATAPGTGGGGLGLPGGASSGSGEKQMSDTVVGAAAQVWPAVVSILGSGLEGEKSSPSGQGAMGLGSGVIFSRAGDQVRIVTNNHVVEGFNQLDVITLTGERRKAKLLGRDQITDLAVLEMDGSGIKQVAEFGDSDALQPGETAIAVGNPLGVGFAPTVTKGIISWPKQTIPVSLGREGELDWEMEVIQTDAAINHGNSGGALVNLDGKVVGINTLKVAGSGVEGLGFAIPINQAKSIIESLIRDQKVKRPYIGVVTQNLQAFKNIEDLKLPKDVKQGILVIEATGPAQNAGLKGSDVIVELDGKPVDSTLSLRKYIYSAKKIGDKLAVTYYRAGKKQTVNVTLEELKDR
ncbi:serine protease Do [Paenibacillus sp. UNCCL117]|uniref:S1C family serine protease n=1 Tax=unclassified Paenibacillus TaxID=185978 RepID=UPI00088B189F|nr:MULTISPECIES: trypsin-like peptidase domain-containing protein [unclassified Paenibacillus]SDD85724.1 serine protease Do [Paenibacillus sp. cl123]SFW54316.1 serine protease Do [Paenibacillus sp. UNCCL117]